MGSDYEYLPATVRAADWHLEPQIGEEGATGPACWSMPPVSAGVCWRECVQVIAAALVAAAVCGWLTLP